MAKYAHTTRTPDTVLTSAVYNADHENHITHGEAQYFDGCSESTIQIAVDMDPGTVGDETLATTVEEEIHQIRFIIRQIKQTLNWVIPTETRKEVINVIPMKMTTPSGTYYPNAFTDSSGTTTIHRGSWMVPDSYASGNVTVTAKILTTNTSNYAFYFEESEIVSGGSPPPTDTTANLTIVTGVNGHQEFSFTLDEEDVADAGNFHTFTLKRDPAHASDNANASCFLVGMYVTYTAYAGRF